MWDAKWRIKVTYFEDSTHNLSFYDAEYDASSPSDVKYACEVYVKSDGFGGMLLEDYLMRMFRGQTLNEYLNTKGGP